MNTPRIYITLLLLTICFRSYSQTFSWVSAAKSGAGGGLTVWDLENDRNGNSYITGLSTGTAIAGYDTVSGGGSFTARVSNQGQFIWAKASYGYKSYGVGVDYNSNCYTAGSLSGGNMFVEKMDSLGNSVWTINFSSNSPTWDYITDIVTDSAGNSYVTGYFSNTITIGAIVLNNAGSYQNIFIAKVDTYGNVAWAKKIGGDFSGCIAQEIIYNKKNHNIYITGSLSGPTDFGGTIITDSTTADIYVARYDTLGNLILAKSVLKYTTTIVSSSVNSLGITCDKQGNTYITGYFEGKLTYGTTTIQNTTTNPGDNDIFVAKVNPSGNTMWARKAGTTNNDYGWGITLDECLNVWVIGQIQGCASCVANFDTQSYPSPSTTINQFVAKYSNSGIIQGVKTSTSNVNEQGIAIKAMPNGNVKIAGIFGLLGSSVTDTIEFDSNDYISQADTTYLYVAQINNCSSGFNDLSYTIPDPLCEGTTITVTSGNPNTSWFDGYFGQINLINNDTSVLWADINTCNNCIKRDTIHLDFINFPHANFSSNISSFTATFTNSSSNATTYNWDFGDGEISTLTNPIHSYAYDGTYTVTLIASNVCGSDTTSFVVNIYTTSIQESETGSIRIYPSIISKNGTIKIIGLNKTESRYEIFNTLGQSVISGYVSSDNTITLTQKASGVFYLVINSQENRFFHKIIVQ